jgi:hypothetical protein
MDPDSDAGRAADALSGPLRPPRLKKAAERIRLIHSGSTSSLFDSFLDDLEPEGVPDERDRNRD